jgi:dUTPase
MNAKISYIIPYKHNIERFLNLNRVIEISQDTERGAGGFGSTGKN